MNRTGNRSSGTNIVYLRFLSIRLYSSSQLVVQNSLSIEIGVEHTMQCLCLGILTFSACFKYFDMGVAQHLFLQRY